MSDAKSQARNLAWNWGSLAANLIVLFFLSPYIVHELGSVGYGIWSLLSVLTGYMGVFDVGVRASTGRHIVLHLGRGDWQLADETIRTALGFFSSLAVVMIAVGFGIGWLFPVVFTSAPQDYLGLIRWLLPLLALNVWLSTLQSVFSSVLVAYERFDLMRSLELTALFFRTAATVVVLKCGLGIAGLTGVALCVSMFGLVGACMLARRTCPQMRAWPLLLRRERLRELLGYGLAAAVTTVSLRLMGQSDLVVAGAALGVTYVTIYSVGAMLVYYSNGFLAQISATFFPSLQRAVARGDTHSARLLFLRANRVGMIFGVLAYVGMAIFSEPFIRLWMHSAEFGENSVRQAALVMTILALAKLPNLYVGASVAVLQATGHVRFTAALSIGEAAINVALSLFFVYALQWGLVGIAVGTLAARLLVGTFIVPRHACEELGINSWKYMYRACGAEIVVAAMFAILCLMVRWLIPGDTWLWFSGQVGFVTAVYAIAAICLLVQTDDRRRVIQRMRWVVGCGSSLAIRIPSLFGKQDLE